jgi:hypothetical protein
MKYFSMLHGQIFNTIRSRTFDVTLISVESGDDRNSDIYGFFFKIATYQNSD